MNPSPPPPTKKQASRFLAQAGFGGEKSQVTTVIENGYKGWLDQQINSRSSFQFFKFAKKWREEDKEEIKHHSAVPNIFWHGLMEGDDVLRKRVILALSELFVVNYQSSLLPWDLKPLAFAHYLDILSRHSFGSFLDLLKEITLCIPMGQMLGTLGNKKGDNQGRKPDENYAREVLQLFTIGLYELNLDGSYKLDSNGKPIETYDNSVIEELSNVFTGWSADLQFGVSRPDLSILSSSLTNNPQDHEFKQVSFFNLTIPKDTPADEAIDLALKEIFNHKNVPPFISRQLIQKLVTSNPSPNYIKRVADIFRSDANGQRGNLGSVIKAILLDPEARAEPNLRNLKIGKKREPIIQAVSLLRTLPFKRQDNIWRLGETHSQSEGLGQGLFSAPSVFNFFSPLYTPPQSELSKENVLAPEMAIANEVSNIGLINFYYSLLFNSEGITKRRYSKRDSQGKLKTLIDEESKGIKLDLDPYLELAENTNLLLDELNLSLAQGQLGKNTSKLIKETLDEIVVENDDKIEPLKSRVKAATLMILASSDFQILK